MEALFASGRIIDLILVLVVLEAVVLLGWQARRADGPSPAALASNLASGAALMLALRASLAGAHWTLLAACLAAALAAHLVDLGFRLRRRPERRFVAAGAARSAEHRDEARRSSRETGLE